uniref:Matrix metallopeptidase 23bb n=1 Tax=Oryzias melastigma TaxID=30732 RepID=A0A3B3CDE7_ORYME
MERAILLLMMMMMKVSAAAPTAQASRSGAAPLATRAMRNRRYAINPLGYKWTHHNITYRIIKFPNTLNMEDTRKAISIAFTKWSDVSPLTFTELPDGNSSVDITLGFFTFNHTDCWWSPLHPCFDGLNGELAHAFLPPRGEIHFDNHEFWILGKSRFSWKQGVWLNDLVQVAAHEIGHALGLWHSRDPQALMHPNATYTGQRNIAQDDVWGIQRLYGCVDKKRLCDSWARLGLCERRKTFMKKNCPLRCDLCFGGCVLTVSLFAHREIDWLLVCFCRAPGNPHHPDGAVGQHQGQDGPSRESGRFPLRNKEAPPSVQSQLVQRRRAHPRLHPGLHRDEGQRPAHRGQRVQ